MIRIGDLTLPDETVAVHERRDTDPDLPARTIRITGSVGDAGTLAELESRLDNVARAALGAETGLVELSLRPGRRITALLQRLDREVHRTGREAVFTALFTSEQAMEEAESDTQLPWTIQAWGAALPVENEGTASAAVHIRFTASGTVLAPAFDDGARRLTYGGIMGPGQVLVVDGTARRVTLNGTDVTAQVSGDYPQLAPGGNTLRFYDDFDSSHQGSAVIAWRARWW
jgi:hypothetical protein